MLYPEMILPFEMIPFAEMKKKQAEQYLQWYVDISLNTLIIAYDISAYLGEVIIKNHPQIKGGYLSKPKRLHGVNRPRLLGFEAGLSAYTYGRVEVCIRKSIKAPGKMYLYNAYEICVNMI